ncbi:MAG TPA: Sec-dependent nitrous-oxide reductase [Gemmatimonadales bacterium]|nr:Sec-dependent nitrous-oxide reductase [Gemmatimonadales bacterium]
MAVKRQVGLSVVTVIAAVAGAMALESCARGGAADVGAIARERGLTDADIVAAVKTYQPTGKMDEYVMFSSGGHSGQVFVIGIPSMRLLKVIAAFTPEPWQGYATGADEHKELMRNARTAGHDIAWGDTHHPALSETDGNYDGQFLFIGDKANPRVAVIDLRDFETKQIVTNPNMGTNHGASFVTPNTEYIIEGSQYSVPLWEDYADMSEYQENYRGLVTLWKFDRARGRIDERASFSLELPPYWHDLSDAGKGPSAGWAFLNSFNAEMATGGVEQGRPPFEAGVSQNDMDYLHVINWQRAAEVAARPGGTRTVRGMKVIPLSVSIAEGLLFLVPEPKSPHGADVTPDGTKIVVSGKLDPHVTVYSWAKMKQAIDAKSFAGKDAFGVPILDFNGVIDGQLELGLGPLHTQFDADGNAYTSVFLDTKVVKWDLEPLQVLDKVDVHYNVGHIATAEGDTRSPDGKYLVSMNKWSIDRFNPVGPLHPQNFQLIDIGGDKMQLLYDMPIGVGEPHYAQIIKADKLSPMLVYPEVGYAPGTMSAARDAVKGGQERIERRGNEVHVYMTAIRSHFTPEHIRVRQGDRVVIHITNLEQAREATHGFAITKYNVHLSLEPGEAQTVTFVADQPGVFPFYCTEFCSALHLEMAGYLLVEPRS